MGPKKIKFISDRNPQKNNLYTPGSNIKIISESQSRKMKPDYYFVLAWHFKKEILLIIIGGIFVLEALSVIFQVIYFKITKLKTILM